MDHVRVPTTKVIYSPRSLTISFRIDGPEGQLVVTVPKRPTGLLIWSWRVPRHPTDQIGWAKRAAEATVGQFLKEKPEGKPEAVILVSDELPLEHLELLVAAIAKVVKPHFTEGQDAPVKFNLGMLVQIASAQTAWARIMTPA